MLRVVGGAIDVGVGAATALGTGGLAILPAVGLMAVGIDQIATGVTNIANGTQGPSVFEFGGTSAARGLGAGEGAAHTIGALTPAALSLAFTGIAGRMPAAGRNAPAASGARAGEGLTGAAADPRTVWSTAAGDVVIEGTNLPGSAGKVIPRRLTPGEMAALQSSHDVEFALIYELGTGKGGRGGRYLLFSGGPTTVWFPLKGNYIWISHSHPAGYALHASAADQAVLKLLQSKGSRQRTSLIAPVDSEPFRFNPTNKRLGE